MADGRSENDSEDAKPDGHYSDWVVSSPKGAAFGSWFVDVHGIEV